MQLTRNMFLVLAMMQNIITEKEQKSFCFTFSFHVFHHENKF